MAKMENMSMSDTISSSTLRYFGGYWYDYWPRTYVNYWPSYSKNTFEQAFKVVSMMIEKGYLDKITLKKFIALVKEVEEQL